jgi:hypothetical protein
MFCLAVAALSFVLLLPGTAFGQGWHIEVVDWEGDVGRSNSLGSTDMAIRLSAITMIRISV